MKVLDKGLARQFVHIQPKECLSSRVHRDDVPVSEHHPADAQSLHNLLQSILRLDFLVRLGCFLYPGQEEGRRVRFGDISIGAEA